MPRDVRIRIIRQPQGTVDGVALDVYRPGQVYEVAVNLAEYLIASGYGQLEMRQDINASPSARDQRRFAQFIIEQDRAGKKDR